MGSFNDLLPDAGQFLSRGGVIVPLSFQVAQAMCHMALGMYTRPGGRQRHTTEAPGVSRYTVTGNDGTTRLMVRLTAVGNDRTSISLIEPNDRLDALQELAERILYTHQLMNNEPVIDMPPEWAPAIESSAVQSIIADPLQSSGVASAPGGGRPYINLNNQALERLRNGEPLESLVDWYMQEKKILRGQARKALRNLAKKNGINY